jgi:hypothetical protein
MNLRRAALLVWVTQALALLFAAFRILRNEYGFSPPDLFRESLFLIPPATLVLFFFILWMELKKR